MHLNEFEWISPRGIKKVIALSIYLCRTWVIAPLYKGIRWRWKGFSAILNTLKFFKSSSLKSRQRRLIYWSVFGCFFSTLTSAEWIPESLIDSVWHLKTEEGHEQTLQNQTLKCFLEKIQGRVSGSPMFKLDEDWENMASETSSFHRPVSGEVSLSSSGCQLQ